jgi:hypothetical protein
MVLLLSLQVLLFTAFLVVGARTTGMDWLLAAGTGALLASSAATFAMQEWRASYPDLYVLVVTYVATGVFFLSRLHAWGTDKSSAVLVVAWIASFSLPAFRSIEDGEDRRLLYAWAAPAGCVAGMLLLAVWRIVTSAISSVISFVRWLTAGIPGGDRQVELLLLTWGLYATAGVFAGLAALATKGMRTAHGYMPDGTLDTAGRPNYNRTHNPHGYDDRTGCMVAVVFVVFLAALLTLAWMGVGGSFASAGIDYSWYPRRFWLPAAAWPLFALYFTAVFCIPGLRWKLKIDYYQGKKGLYRGYLRGSYALLIVGAVAAGFFAFMYVRRLSASGG